MSLGDRITELRKACGMNQADLARAMDVTRQAVSKWETDQSSPDAANLIRLADLLDTDIEYLTTGRRSYGRRPPIVLNSTQIVEKIVEKPVVQTVEKIVEFVNVLDVDDIRDVVGGQVACNLDIHKQILKRYSVRRLIWKQPDNNV